MNFICLAATNLEGVAVTITTAFNNLVDALRMFHPGGGRFPALLPCKIEIGSLNHGAEGSLNIAIRAIIAIIILLLILK